jgi:hypothetical protein
VIGIIMKALRRGDEEKNGERSEPDRHLCSNVWKNCRSAG